MLSIFFQAKFHEIKKVNKLINALMNQAKNHVESRLKIKNIGISEKAFLDEMKKNEE